VILLDTTVLLYAIGDEHAVRAPCAALIDAHGDGRVELTTTVEVVQEFTHVRSRRKGRADAVGIARAYARLFELLMTRPEDLQRGLALYEDHPRVGAFDAVLAGVALNRGAEALVSADRAFAEITGLRHHAPDDPAIAALIDAG